MTSSPLLELRQTESGRLEITADFPGGNIRVSKIDGDRILLGPDLRDTTTDWFYWYFAVRGAAGRTLEFVFEPRHVGVRGPAVSVDGGANWKWLGADAVKEGAFSYTFPSEADDIRFSVGMPYLQADWKRFVASLGGTPFFQQALLSLTPEGREVPMLLGGHGAPNCVLITARHHACEMMASYVLEGIVEGVTGEGSNWLREQVDFCIVPFMDTDGVEQGDQGKNRAPHDHNRDYNTARYHEVRDLKNFVPGWSADRRLITFDLHDPALSGPVHESVFFVEPEDRREAALMDEFAACLERAHQGVMKVVKPWKLAFGAGFNSTPSAGKATFSTWAAGLPGAYLNTSLEIPYANASGSEVNADSARELGRSFAQALSVWLQKKPITE